MNKEFASAFEEMLTSVAKDAASEAIRQFRLEERQRQQHGDGDRLLLRSHEAAEQLAISPATLQRLTSSGELPCVRIGSSVRYSSETLREWIQQKEATTADDPPLSKATTSKANKCGIRDLDSADTPEPRPKVGPVVREAKEAKSPPVSTSKQAEPKMKRSSKNTARKIAKIETKQPSKKRQLKTKKSEPEEERRISPFDLLLKEIGVDRDALPPTTNGDLMKIAGVDIPTLHGWQWHNRALPTEALQRLKDHFIQYRKD